MPGMKRLFTRLIPVVLAAVTTPALAASPDLIVGAASSLQDVLQEIHKSLPADVTSAVNVRYNFAATSALARQIEADAPIDVLVSADEANMERLEQAGKVEPGSRAVVTANEIVLIVKPALARDAILKPADLTKPEIKHVALCDPSVPIGHYGKELLEKLGLWSKIEPKLVRPDNVRATLHTVETDAADAGFVYVTDVKKDSKVRIVFRAGEKDGLSIRYPAAVIKGSKHKAAALKYVAHLRSAVARAAFKSFGFAQTPDS